MFASCGDPDGAIGTSKSPREGLEGYNDEVELLKDEQTPTIGEWDVASEEGLAEGIEPEAQRPDCRGEAHIDR